MTYVRYFRAGKEAGFTPGSGSLDAMKKVAAIGMARHGLDRAEIVDRAGFVLWRGMANGAEVTPVLGNLLHTAARTVAGIARRA
ncbi:MAG: hypothetical protein V4475_07710 [Pseudomonadota bacterium]